MVRYAESTGRLPGALETDCTGVPRSAKGMKKVKCSAWDEQRAPLSFCCETAAVDLVVVVDDDDDDDDDGDGYNDNDNYD